MDGPWKSRPKSPFDELMDCLAAAPAILQRSNRIPDLRSTQLLYETMDLLERCWSLDARLRKIYARIEAVSDRPLYWPVLSQLHSPVDDPIQGKVFPVAFEFGEDADASTLAMYWAISVMLWSGMCDLYALLSTLELASCDAYCADYPSCTNNRSCRCADLVMSSDGTVRMDLTRLPDLGSRADYMDSARNVCQSMQYFLQRFPIGLFLLSTPISMVYHTVKDKHAGTREVAWMKEAMLVMQRNGLRIYEYQ
jgi:hypothetical protein